MKQSCAMYISPLHYHGEGWRKDAVSIYLPSLQQGTIKKSSGKDKEKLQYVYISLNYKKERIKKSCAMYISSLHYNKEE